MPMVLSLLTSSDNNDSFVVRSEVGRPHVYLKLLNAAIGLKVTCLRIIWLEVAERPFIISEKLCFIFPSIHLKSNKYRAAILPSRVANMDECLGRLSVTTLYHNAGVRRGTCQRSLIDRRVSV